MIRDAVFKSKLCNQFIVYIIIYSIWDSNASGYIFFSETFETCGIFLQDFQKSSYKQGDVIHEILEHLWMQQISLTSLIIISDLSKKEIHPDSFRSMKYDCFLYVHINYGKDLFSTIPSFENSLQRALYQKALFLLFVKRDPHVMLTSESWNFRIYNLNGSTQYSSLE